MGELFFQIINPNDKKCFYKQDVTWFCEIGWGRALTFLQERDQWVLERHGYTRKILLGGTVRIVKVIGNK